MQIIVTELPIEDAVQRARLRFERADERLARTLSGSNAALPWIAIGAIGVVGATLGLMGMFPLPGEVTVVMAVLLALGGAFLGYGLPLWSRVRAEKKRRTREWHHALEMLRLREQQAEENPELTVEVLDRVDRRRPPSISKWHERIPTTTKYLQ